MLLDSPINTFARFHIIYHKQASLTSHLAPWDFQLYPKEVWT